METERLRKPTDRRSAWGIFPSGIAVADFNGDGYPDLAVTNQNDNSVSILLGNGDGTFRAGVVLVAGQRTDRDGDADFNNDGFQDLAVVNNTDNTVAVFLGNGDGTFQRRALSQRGTARYRWSSAMSMRTDSRTWWW
jgi:hypothetical protein